MCNTARLSLSANRFFTFSSVVFSTVIEIASTVLPFTVVFVFSYELTATAVPSDNNNFIGILPLSIIFVFIRLFSKIPFRYISSTCIGNRSRHLNTYEKTYEKYNVLGLLCCNTHILNVETRWDPRKKYFKEVQLL